MDSVNKQKGIALITVLLIVALVTIIAAEMAVRMQMQIKRVDNLNSNQQAYWYAISAEELAKLVLNESSQDNDGVLNLTQPWAVEDMVFPVEGGQISGNIYDLQACFNINAVVEAQDNNTDDDESDSDAESAGEDTQPENENGKKSLKPTPQEQFKSLLILAGIDDYEAEQIRDGVADWLDQDSIARSYGAEDYMYEAKEMPYLAANGYFVDVSELKLIQGLDNPTNGQAALDKILPFVCVIPNNDKMVLNINTIKPEQAEVLAAMFDNKLTVAAASSVIESRPEDGFDDINDFWELSEIKAVGRLSKSFKEQFSLKSEFFRLKSKTEYNQSWINLNSLIALDKQGKFVVIAREIGV
ncbi:type II secretion system minor pseudopilin GspK [Catenovulum sp. 2E275]|uniref:type II secretion system minor pseudopilin GspK n=1 Tax=Catenovulum sp. 2E275 TaxID=2980497 RepID=UPI0021CDFE7D|nr:type II secretion system minor pseudopilin GspK [Catenovulum sp. 2E275]MCU4674387.1 type II secretion system minor pseudopilin GspK [Catenovulum sp. 2E275]